jgi:hypothetical protein
LKLASERSSSRFDFVEAQESAILSRSPANASEIPAAVATATVAPVAPAVISTVTPMVATPTVATPTVATPTAATPTAVDFEKAIQERAFWIWKETGCDDPVANYFRALREVQSTLREPFESSRGLFEKGPDVQAGVVR